MTAGDRLREALSLLPPGAGVSLTREQLLDALGPATADAAPELLTVADLAARLHRSASTVRGWCERGRFPQAFKLNGRDWRVPLAALDAFVAAQRPAPPLATRAGHRSEPPADLGAWRQTKVAP